MYNPPNIPDCSCPVFCLSNAASLLFISKQSIYSLFDILSFLSFSHMPKLYEYSTPSTMIFSSSLPFILPNTELFERSKLTISEFSKSQTTLPFSVLNLSAYTERTVHSDIFFSISASVDKTPSSLNLSKSSISELSLKYTFPLL